MTFDVVNMRKSLPALDSGIAFFDGPGGSQVPKVVADRIAEVIASPISNRGSVTISEMNAEKIVGEYRNSVADLVGGDPKGVIFGRSWTQLTYDFSRTLAKRWKAGDEIIVTRLDHDSNIRPWIQAAEKIGVTVRWAEFDLSTGELSPSVFEPLLSDKTKLVAFTGACNVLGTKTEISTITNLVHQVGALAYVDGVHLTPHLALDMNEMGADFYGFSSYKLFGPHCASLIAKPELLAELDNDKLLPSTNAVPERFEFGTLPYELLAGVTASIDYVASFGGDEKLDRRSRIVAAMDSFEAYEMQLFSGMKEAISELPGIKMYGHAKDRTPTLYFTFPEVESASVYRQLAAKGINAPASNFYAIETCNALGLGAAGAIRVGLAPYSNQDDIDRLLGGLREIIG